MLDLIPEDYFTYLCNINYKCYKDSMSIFLTCRKLYLMGNTITNNILGKNYKVLIQDYYIEDPKKTYCNIYDTYGRDFTMLKYNSKLTNFITCKSKITNLAIESILTNNINLLYLLYKVVPDSMNMKDVKTKMIKAAMDVKSISTVNYLLLQSPLLAIFEAEEIVIYYYSNKINSHNIIETIIAHNDTYVYTFMKQSLINHDLHIFKLLANDENVNWALKTAIHESDTNAVRYMTDTFEYDINLITEFMKRREKFKSLYSYVDHSMIDLLIEISSQY